MATKGNGKMTGKPVTYRAPSPASGVQMETFIPWTLVKRHVRREIITPLDAPGEFRQEAAMERSGLLATQDTPLKRALGLAHHWQRLLDDGRVDSITAIAEAERINVTQVRRLMRLILLAPHIVNHFVGSQGATLEHVVRHHWPPVWAEQDKE